MPPAPPKPLPGITVLLPLTPLPALPSAFDFGRLSLVASDVSERFEAAASKVPSNQPSTRATLENGDALAFDRELAPRDLALTLPARILGDAAMQITLGAHVLGRLCAIDLTEGQQAVEMCKLRRMVASVRPVVTHAAGLTLSEVGGR